MLVVGLTGGIGSGKSTVATLFAKKGISIIDTDQISRDITNPDGIALNAIVKEFGNDILLPDKTLNRSLLRKKIFDNSNERVQLEQILHPLIREEIKKQVALATSPYCIVVIPLLFETKPNPLINRILVVDAPESLQIERAKVRDQLTEEAIQAILDSQVAREIRLHGAQDVINNDGSMADLQFQVDALHEHYLALSKS